MTCECMGKMKSCMGPRETWAARARRWWLCYQTMKRGLAPVYLPGLDCLSIIMFNSLKGRMMNLVTVFHTTPHIVSINLQQNWKGPWLEKLSLLCAVWSWGHKLLTLLLPHLPVMFLLFPGLVLSTGMCTELFQFHISPVASTPSNQTSDSDTPLRMLQTQWLQKLHEEALIRMCLLKVRFLWCLKSPRDPFTVPLAPATLWKGFRWKEWVRPNSVENGEGPAPPAGWGREPIKHGGVSPGRSTGVCRH